MTGPPKRSERISVRKLWPRVPGAAKSFGFVLGLSATLQVFAFLAPLQMQLVIDQAITAGDRRVLDVVAIAFGALVIIQALIEFIRSRLQMLLTQAMGFQVMVNAVDHLLGVPVPFFEDRTVGDVVSRISSSRVAQDMVTRIILTVLLDGLMAIGALVVMLAYSWLLTIIVIIALAIVTTVQWVVFPVQRRISKEEIEARAAEQTHLMESLRGIQTIRLSGLESQRVGSWRTNLFGATQAAIRGNDVSTSLVLFRTVINGLQSVLVIYLGAQLVIGSGGFTLGMLVAYLAYQMMFITRFNALMTQVTQFRFIGLHLERASDILLSPREPIDASAHGPAPCGDIVLKGLSYRYPSNDDPTIAALDMAIEDGTFVAITGPSGGGKSTLIKLILGIYRPSAGAILVGGRELTDASWRAWRQTVGAVTQNDRLFSGTLAANISHFELEPDSARISQAARLACLHDEILRMPGGYESVVGDMGDMLSAGQRQRLLLARALYRDPRVLILDEGTANLDRENEAEIAKILAGLAMTRIVVAHRPALIEAADVVHVMREGRLGRESDFPSRTRGPT